jgi:hypothetical protein
MTSRALLAGVLREDRTSAAVVNDAQDFVKRRLPGCSKTLALIAEPHTGQSTHRGLAACSVVVNDL